MSVVSGISGRHHLTVYFLFHASASLSYFSSAVIPESQGAGVVLYTSQLGLTGLRNYAF